MNYRNLLISALLVPVTAQSAGFDQASKRYGIHPDLLRAISMVESNGNAKAINRSNKSRSHDIGHMLINSSWLPKLARYGITEQSLFDPCVNTLVGAWVLADNFKRLGYNWNAIGACTAQPTQKQYMAGLNVQLLLKKYSMLPGLMVTGDFARSVSIAECYAQNGYPNHSNDSCHCRSRKNQKRPDTSPFCPEQR